MAKEAELRARCEERLADEVEQLAERKHLKVADIVRLAVIDYVETHRPAAAGSAEEVGA